MKYNFKNIVIAKFFIDKSGEGYNVITTNKDNYKLDELGVFFKIRCLLKIGSKDGFVRTEFVELWIGQKPILDGNSSKYEWWIG